MKKTFNTKTEKKNGFRPYKASYKGETFNLFLLTPTTSMRRILDIQHSFKNENLIFAFKDMRVATKGMQLFDATNHASLDYFENGEKPTWEAFFYDENCSEFFKATLQEKKKFPENVVITNYAAKIKLI